MTHSSPIGSWRANKPPVTGSALEALLKSPKIGVECLIPEFAYRGKVTVIYGDPSIGKTTIALNMAACGASGRAVFDQLPVKPLRIYLALFETSPHEVAETLLAIQTQFAILWDNIILDVDLIGIDIVHKLNHAEMAINRMKAFRPDIVFVDPLVSLVVGGLSKDEPCVAVMRFLEEICYKCDCAVIAFHHAKKEQFNVKGESMPSSYYGAIWIRSHARIMWEVKADKGARVLRREKDNLGVCRAKLTLYFDHSTCLCTMKESSEDTVNERVIAYFNGIGSAVTVTTNELADKLGFSVRAIKAAMKDEHVLKWATLTRKPGHHTTWSKRVHPTGSA